MDPARISYLFDLYEQRNASDTERQELLQWLRDYTNREEALEYLVNEIRATTPVELEKSEKWEAMIRRILAEETKLGAAPVIRMWKSKGWLRIAAILLLIATGSYFLFNNNDRKNNDVVKTIPAHDVPAPDNNRSMITLADGRTIYLDNVGNGELALQGNIKVIKLANGQIAYENSSGEVINDLQYNTLTNPRGSKVIDMQLSDGSHVWLNAGSSVTYPVVFVGNERKVNITGEAYFEVAHNSSMPFKVTKGTMEVTVLGTHFNVNAYDDEAEIKVTLLEGSVQVKNDENSNLLKPGQQAQVGNDVKIVSDIDLEEVMAWKNGFFQFNRASLQEVLRQLTQWYDVDVVYEGIIPDRQFLGEMERDLNLSQVLIILEKNKVHFKIEGKKLIVMP